MSYSDLPASAAWRHSGFREGYEAVFLRADENGCRLDGHTVAVEAGKAWVVRYEISLNSAWITTAARIWAWSHQGSHTVQLESHHIGQWQLNGYVVPELEGCIDVDLESSCCTNTIPVHRLQLGVGQSAEAPAAYVRALDLSVQRLEQRYTRVDDETAHQQYHYQSPSFEFEARLIYDASGLVLEYPGIGSRVL